MRISTAQYYKTNADQLQARQNKVAEVQAMWDVAKQQLRVEGAYESDEEDAYESDEEDT